MKLNQITLDSVRHDAEFAVLNTLKARYFEGQGDEITAERISRELHKMSQRDLPHYNDLLRCAKFAYATDDFDAIARRIAPQLAAMLIPADEAD